MRDRLRSNEQEPRRLTDPAPTLLYPAGNGAPPPGARRLTGAGHASRAGPVLTIALIVDAQVQEASLLEVSSADEDAVRKTIAAQEQARPSRHPLLPSVALATVSPPLGAGARCCQELQRLRAAFQARPPLTSRALPSHPPPSPHILVLPHLPAC